MELKFGRINEFPGAVQCLQCGMILVSFSVHDYKTCRCPNETTVDGGHDYLRCGGKDLSKVSVLQFNRGKTIHEAKLSSSNPKDFVRQKRKKQNATKTKAVRKKRTKIR